MSLESGIEHTKEPKKLQYYIERNLALQDCTKKCRDSAKIKPKVILDFGDSVVINLLFSQTLNNGNFISLKMFATYSCEPPKTIGGLQLITWCKCNTNSRIIKK